MVCNRCSPSPTAAIWGMGSCRRKRQLPANLHYETNKENLPDDFKEVIIEGGCHAYFGMYGAQEGDGVPAITNEEQILRTVEAIDEL